MDSVCFASEHDMAQILKGRFRPDVDPRELALYTPADAAYYLGIHPKDSGHLDTGPKLSDGWRGEVLRTRY